MQIKHSYSANFGCGKAKRVFLFAILAAFCAGGNLPAPAGAGTDTGAQTVDTLIAVGECRLNFRVIYGNGVTVVLEAGGGMDSSEWDKIGPQIALKTGATVVSYDRAGFGKSDLPGTPYSFDIEAKWLWNALQQLGLDNKVVLAGHSYGGWFIRYVANEHREAVKGIVFIDPFSTEFVDLMGVEYLDQHPMAGKHPFDTSHPEKLTKQQKALVRMVGDGLGPKSEVMRKTSVPQGIPVFLITSGKPFLPKPEEQLAWRKSHEQVVASIDGAILLVAEESDHMIPFSQPDMVVNTVVKVIRDTN